MIERIALSNAINELVPSIPIFSNDLPISLIPKAVFVITVESILDNLSTDAVCASSNSVAAFASPILSPFTALITVAIPSAIAVTVPATAPPTPSIIPIITPPTSLITSPIDLNISGTFMIAVMRTLPITSAILIITGANSSMAFVRTLPITSAILIMIGAIASNAGAATLSAAPKPIIPRVNTAKPAMTNGFANAMTPLANPLRIPAIALPIPLPIGPNAFPSAANPCANDIRSFPAPEPTAFIKTPIPLPSPAMPAPRPVKPLSPLSLDPAPPLPVILSAICLNRSSCVDFHLSFSCLS